MPDATSGCQRGFECTMDMDSYQIIGASFLGCWVTLWWAEKRHCLDSLWQKSIVFIMQKTREWSVALLWFVLFVLFQQPNILY